MHTEIVITKRYLPRYQHLIVVNGYIQDEPGLWASKELPSSATPEQIRHAVRRVRANTLRAFRRFYGD